MMLLSNRPLGSGLGDQAMFVDRRVELELLDRACRFGFSAAVTGSRGVGVTTLLNRHAADLSDAGAKVVWVRAAAEITGAGMFVEHVQAAAGVASRVPSEVAQGARMFFGHEEVPDVGSPRGLARIAKAIGEATVVVDGPLLSDVVLDVFGRWRDELWEYPKLRWVVHVEGIPSPADSFFDVTVDVGTLPAPAARELITRRLQTASGSEAEVVATLDARLDDLVERAGGVPRHLMDRLRLAVLEPAEHAAAVAHQVAAAEDLGEMAGRLARLLETADRPLSASDEELAMELGVSRGRLSQLLRELEDHGIVTGRRLAPDGPGRPRKGYALHTDEWVEEQGL